MFKRFRDWVKADVFKCMFDAVSDEPDIEYALVDATIVRVHRHGRAVQRCAASGVSPGRNSREENGGGAFEAGFPEWRNSDSWGGNRVGGCRDRVLTAAGPAGGGA